MSSTTCCVISGFLRVGRILSPSITRPSFVYYHSRLITSSETYPDVPVTVAVYTPDGVVVAANSIVYVYGKMGPVSDPHDDVSIFRIEATSFHAFPILPDTTTDDISAYEDSLPDWVFEPPVIIASGRGATAHTPTSPSKCRRFDEDSSVPRGIPLGLPSTKIASASGGAKSPTGPSIPGTGATSGSASPFLSPSDGNVSAHVPKGKSRAK
ncbi:hypothetical protein FISHEDRAFT_77691 [Fistulina hepatica ATCC 64428]|nr:hypothetical protein FISHEDRAFT_77691 [Fistulina hepatica ATCC 64428]